MRQLDRIKQKLDHLRQQDPAYHVFEASSHQYQLNPCLDEAQIQQFEHQHAIVLPAAYRSFLQQLGNGGAGPYYGIYPLEKTIRPWCFAHDPYYLAKPFPLTEGIDLFRSCAETDDFEDYLRQSEADDVYAQRVSDCMGQYSAPVYSQGALEICEYGCAITFLLIVIGSEAGAIWVDDRAHDAGLFPLSQRKNQQVRVDFLTWYEHWLDTSLRHLNDPDAPTSDGYFEYGYSSHEF